MNGRVLVPTKIFKAIYCPKKGQGAAFIVNNAPGENFEVVSIAQIEQVAGIRLFPKMHAIAKQTAMNLPSPSGSNNGGYKKHMPSVQSPYKIASTASSDNRECGTKHTCREMSSCNEAMFYLNTCGVKSLDGNNDGIPCIKLCK